jgi:hypothetical protein
MTLGAIGFACIALVLASLYCVIRIVTVPIVMKNMLTVINFIFIALGAGKQLTVKVWLSFVPGVLTTVFFAYSGVFAYGLTVKSRDEMTAGQEWIGESLVVTVWHLWYRLSIHQTSLSCLRWQRSCSSRLARSSWRSLSLA